MFTKNNVYLFTVTINSFFNSTYHPNILLKVPFLIFFNSLGFGGSVFSIMARRWYPLIISCGR